MDSVRAAKPTLPLPLPLPVIGVTGGIGCGKTTVSNLLAKHHIPVIDADVIAHQLTAPNGAAIAQIRDTFGDGMIDADGSLNRTAMREKVFQNPAEKLRLENILHPAIRDEILSQISRYSHVHHQSPKQPPYLVLVAPLLFESLSYRNIVSRTLVVDCAHSVQIARVMLRSGISAEDIQRIIQAQIPRAIRLQLADDLVCNDGPSVAIEAPIERLHQFYLSCAHELTRIATQTAGAASIGCSI